LAKTIAVMFLGVPSQGSKQAPNPGIQSYLYKLMGADKIAGVCGRQAQDMFPGLLNTYLRDLERRWEELLNTRRAASHSPAPLVHCAYETVPEPLLGGVTSTMIVDELYAQTQCSSAQFALPTSHTMLPKPESLQDDLHRAWFSRRLDDLFRQWSQWTFTRYEFLPTDTFETFARVINRNQRSFVLSVDDVRNASPVAGAFDGADNFVVMAKVAKANPSICLDVDWPSNGPGRAAFRPAGRCHR
jgi:Txe/YoeB family toxin of Txe-Axe toxin-antitoxin module